MSQLEGKCLFCNSTFINHNDREKKYCNLTCNSNHYMFIKKLKEEPVQEIKELIEKYVDMKVPSIHLYELWNQLKQERRELERKSFDQLRKEILLTIETKYKAQILSMHDKLVSMARQ